MYIKSWDKTRSLIIKDKEMTLVVTTLHQPNREQQGNGWTIMTRNLPCSFIAKPDNYEGRDLHSLE